MSEAAASTQRAAETERAIAEFFEEVLDVDEVDPGLSLLELGGNSLAATMVANRIELSWGFRPSLEELLTLPLHELAETCERARLA